MAATSSEGFSGKRAAEIVGITYRQLDYWARTGLVEPTVRPAGGSGTQRLYSFRDILLLKVIKRLLDAGISLQQIRQAHAISNPTLANIEKRWDDMPPQEQADLWMSLRDRMKVDWKEMTMQEKKAGA